MSDDGDQKKASGQSGPTGDRAAESGTKKRAQTEREARLAAALRDNLKRRKQQARARKD